MRRRRFIGSVIVGGMLTLLMAIPVGAASITYTPTTITYGVPSMTKVTGLTPNTSYTLQIYSPVGLPIIPGGFPIFADATGSFTSPDLTPDQTDLPGGYLFEVASLDGKIVARATPTLVGTNNYYAQHRLGA